MELHPWKGTGTTSVFSPNGMYSVKNLNNGKKTGRLLKKIKTTLLFLMGLFSLNQALISPIEQHHISQRCELQIANSPGQDKSITLKYKIPTRQSLYRMFTAKSLTMLCGGGQEAHNTQSVQLFLKETTSRRTRTPLLHTSQ